MVVALHISSSVIIIAAKLVHPCTDAASKVLSRMVRLVRLAPAGTPLPTAGGEQRAGACSYSSGGKFPLPG